MLSAWTTISPADSTAEAYGCTTPRRASLPTTTLPARRGRVAVGGPGPERTARLGGSLRWRRWDVWRCAPIWAPGGRRVDPRLTGVLRAGAQRGVVHRPQPGPQRRSARLDDTVVPVRATPGLALQAYLDEVLIAVLRHPELLPKESDCASAAADSSDCGPCSHEKVGWTIRPSTTATRRRPTTSRAGASTGPAWASSTSTFSSGWEPEPVGTGLGPLDGARGQPDRARLGVARVPGRHHRSWLVCAHGLGMGNNPAMDLRAFRASQLGAPRINVVVPVLPLHGPRASGRGRGEDLMTIDMVDSHARRGPGRLGPPAHHPLAARGAGRRAGGRDRVLARAASWPRSWPPSRTTWRA